MMGNVLFFHTMKTLRSFSYITATMALLTAIFFIFLAIEHYFSIKVILTQCVLFTVLGFAQLLHTIRVAKFIDSNLYHPTDQLDEHLLNDLKDDEYIVETHYWQKIVTTVNSIALSLLVIYVGMQISSIFQSLLSPSSFTDTLLSILILVLFFSAVPTIVFNLRTHQLSRVVKG
jgi:hypothetical protein